MISAWTRWRAARRVRRADALAVRAEFELERPRGFAAIRSLLRDVGELERARMTSHAERASQTSAGKPAPRRTLSQRR